MGKRKRSLVSFPWEIDDRTLRITKTGNEIITDAGWKKLSFEQACQYFKAEEIKEWYSSYWEGADTSDLFAELGVDIDVEDSFSVDNFFENFDWAPKTVDVIVAKAVYANHAWVRVLQYELTWRAEVCFDYHEREAILLGVHMRKQLGLDIPVINDNTNAVRSTLGYTNIGWQPRKGVAAAHKLSISKATKIYDQDLWDEEWEDEEYDSYHQF
ncbi:hypothetical protein NIES4071_39740 [Calothrix sp. NIES-4071]|nr:hypothetical protein NIES4071_39740 [Calothrix sp. NIES-4071]BAZ58292.1 hypothetical protein NIES4105_39680 [Calothrix sp. NIES-4105]